MISSEVQRTLVKSPPELWAEISDPEALARHLGEFGEIRITRVQPEKEVAWEAAEASGTVAIKPSGWGTKVRLTVTRELAELARSDVDPDAQDTEDESSPTAPAEEPPERELAAGAAAEPDRAAAEPEPDPEAEHEDRSPSPQSALDEVEDAPAKPEAAVPEQELAVEDEDVREQPLEGSSPEPKRGLFARLFGFRRARRAVALASELGSLQAERSDLPRDLEPEEDDEPPKAELSPPAGLSSEGEAPAASDEPASEDEAPTESPALAASAPQPGSEVSAKADGDLEPAVGPAVRSESGHPPARASAALAEEIREAEEAAEEQVTAVLTGVLDRLGAAHHRPFSRA